MAKAQCADGAMKVRSRCALLLAGGALLGLLRCLQVAEDRARGRPRQERGGDKEIVAYSLLKRIESESAEFDCGEALGGDGDARGSRQRRDSSWTKVEGTEFYLYSVHVDRRLAPYEYLRVIGVIKGDWNSPIFCQIRCSDGNHRITKATATKIWSKNWNQNDTNTYYNPFLLSCRIPLNQNPITLSLSTNPCRISRQRFEIEPKPPPPIIANFTVCVKPLNFDSDNSEHLLQWIAVNQVLGASKIEFYVEDLHENSRAILATLQEASKGLVTVRRHVKVEPEGAFDDLKRVWQKRRYEIVAYNDCFYHNIHSSRFVVPVDVDEIIVPRRALTWSGLLDASDGDVASLTVRNAYYLRRFNGGGRGRVFFLRDVVRTEFSGEGESGKSFVSTKNTLTVFNHYALEVLKPGIRQNRFLEPEVAQMNHYKDDCSVAILPECAKYLSSRVRVRDDVISRFKKRFYQQYAELLRQISRWN